MAINNKLAGPVDYSPKEVPAANTLANNNAKAYENYTDLVRAYDRLVNLKDALSGYGAETGACLEECMPNGIVDFAARVNKDTAITISEIHQIIGEISDLLN